ncbi:MAG: M28 family peptidase [Gemmatimonadaceae bacterium]
MRQTALSPLHHLVLVALLAAPSPSPAAAQVRNPDPARATDPANGPAREWWAHVTFLADDRLLGRGTGSAGHKEAAAYVADAFRRAGLRPGGTDGYLQPVRFRVRRIVEEQSSLALVRNGTVEPLVLGEDATLGIRGDPAAQLEAPLVFLGYGLVAPEVGHDDLAGIDLRGKVAVMVGGGPSSLTGPLQAHHQSVRWANLRRAGAVGLVVVPNPRGSDIPWARSALSRFNPVMMLADTALDDTRGQQLSVTFNAARAEKLFAGSGHTLAELLALADSGKKLPTFALPASIRAAVRVESRELTSDNVVGILPGSDPALRGEYVVMTAHLDHLGVGRPIDGDSIYNGAMDNGAGTATLLETARGASAPGRRFARSVIFLAVTAEESGLLGSRYFAAHPTVPAGAIVANVNTDMFLPLFPLRGVIANGLEESDMADDLRRVAEPLGLRVLSDPEPERNAFVRSDQYSFIRRGVPALSLKAGFERNSPEHEIVKRFRTDRYHAPADDLQQDVNLQAAADFNRLALDLVQAVANRPARPRWNADSFFRRFAE